MLEFAGWLRTIRLVGPHEHPMASNTEISGSSDASGVRQRDSLPYAHSLLPLSRQWNCQTHVKKGGVVILSYLIFFFFFGGGGKGNTSCTLAPSSGMCGAPTGFASGPILPLDGIPHILPTTPVIPATSRYEKDSISDQTLQIARSPIVSELRVIESFFYRLLRYASRSSFL